MMINFVMSPILLGITIVVIYHVLKAIARKVINYKKWIDAIRNVPCEDRHWFYGHMLKYNSTEEGMMRELKSLKRFPNCVQRWFGRVCAILGYHPSIAKTLLNSNAPKSNFGGKYILPWIGHGLLARNGESWKRHRRLLTPIFHFHSLKRYLPCVNDAAMIMLKKWKSSEDSNSVSVETFQEVSVMSLDSLLRCMFSKESGCDSGENLKYLEAVKCLTRKLTERRFNPFYHFNFVYYQTQAGKQFKASVKIAHEFTENAIRHRAVLLQAGSGNQHKSNELDFLDVLLMAKDENGKGLTHKEIRDELDTFVFAGHDTVTSGISWALYNLALYPHMQEHCRDEVKRVLGGGARVEWQHLPKLVYLTKFIKESMRLYSPVRQLSRQLTQPMAFHEGFPRVKDSSWHTANKSNVKIFPTESLLHLGINLLHRHPTIWNDPDRFDPERFSPENIAKRPPHAYIPFSTGPRNCIGQNFAMNEMKVVLALALSLFKFSVDTTRPKPEMQLAVILKSKSGIHLIAEKL